MGKPTKEKEEVKLTSEEMQEALRKAEQDNYDACLREIQVVLQKYKCDIYSSMIVTERGNVPRIEIGPLRK